MLAASWTVNSDGFLGFPTGFDRRVSDCWLFLQRRTFCGPGGHKYALRLRVTDFWLKYVPRIFRLQCSCLPFLTLWPFQEAWHLQNPGSNDEEVLIRLKWKRGSQYRNLAVWVILCTEFCHCVGVWARGSPAVPPHSWMKDRLCPGVLSTAAITLFFCRHFLRRSCYWKIWGVQGSW